MRNIVYYVASSLDGCIAGPNGDISLFEHHEPLVTHYMAELEAFDTVIMGRSTYEFGYQYGLKPGQPAYAHMQHYIYSNTLSFEEPHEQVHALAPDLDHIRQLKEEEGTDIYLCGGGMFAGWLLDHGLIDVLKVKLNPILLGNGIPLFGQSQTALPLTWREKTDFGKGFFLLTYLLKTPRNR
ncbi:MAG: dihydrofolate reductase family protein [Bacteroidota bacterium]